jgi:hypothetical protein
MGLCPKRELENRGSADRGNVEAGLADSPIAELISRD